MRTPSRGQDHTQPDPEVLDESSVLPQLTGLQFLVLAALTTLDEISGRDLRAWLATNRVKSSGPQFYQMMARLEDSGYVEGWYAQKEIEHQIVNERRYSITAKGHSAWENTRDFYSAHSDGKQQKGVREIVRI